MIQPHAITCVESFAVKILVYLAWPRYSAGQKSSSSPQVLTTHGQRNRLLFQMIIDQYEAVA